ncbi:MAG: phosphoglycerate kinase [Alphaproteobacteria bacterium]|nr:phosphoglycerate kinase [Alphaproteobacteria bacterium]
MSLVNAQKELPMSEGFVSLKDFDVTNKKVLVRADLNVPRQNGVVTDTSRIDRLKPTIDYLISKGAKILILSHFGRPEGEQNAEMSLAFLVPVLEKQWGAPVSFSPDCIGDHARDMAKILQKGHVLLLENIRFYKGEKDNDPEFAKELASLGDLYVNDAFSVSHRAHASTAGITEFLPSAAGLLMEEELNALNIALEKPQKPVLAVAGGSKISSKLNVLNNLVEKVDYLVLGGGMANTFLYANGVEMGKSLCEKGMKEEAKAVMEKAKANNCEIILPRDVVVVTHLKENAEHQTVNVHNIPEDHMAIDIGPETISYIEEKIKTCKTIVWNGPMGVFEIKPFDHGTNEISACAAKLTKAGQIVSVAGGGDTVSALENAGIAKDFSYISTAGGAFLEWLEGKVLPGVDALKQ